MFRTLLQRLTTAYFILLALVIGAMSISALNLSVTHLERQISKEMLAEANLLEQAILDQYEPPEQLVREYKRATGARYTVIAADGSVLADTDKNPAVMENHLGRPEVQQALHSGTGTSTRFSTTTKIFTKYVARTIGGNSQNGFVRVAYPLSVLSTLKQKVTLRNLWIMMIAALLTGGLVYLLLRNLIKPIRDMSEASKTIASGDFSRRIKVSGSAEVRELADSFNSMAVDLSKLMHKLTNERKRIELILESMEDGVVVCDQNGRLTLINPSAEHIFQVQKDSVLGHHILEVIRNYELASAFERALTADESQQEELRLFTPRELVISVQITPVHDESGRIQGAVGTIHDFTTLRQLEQLRTEFVSNVSHELKTPLTSIKGFTETLLEEELDAETRRHFLEIINTESHRLSRLINDLLDLSKLESHQARLNLRKVDLSDVAFRVIQLLENQIRDKGITVEHQFEPDFPLIQGDADMLAQVFLNLLENAIKYTPAGGKVILSGSFQEPSVTVAVSDTGLGIPNKDLPRVFERFYRVDKARSRQLGGTGLGLAIVKHIIERHHGQISVESQVNQGTTFYITLPRNQK